MAQMDAYRWVPGALTLQKQRIPVPAISEDKVLVKILAAGMCHSDFIWFDPEFSAVFPPKAFTMGHEGAGVIVSMGSTVQAAFPELYENQYVAIHSRNPCRLSTCPHCSIGADNTCATYENIGLGLDGSYAEYIEVLPTAIVPVPGTIESLPPAKAAVATDAVLTPYHAMKTCGGITADQTVLIIGIGGLGACAIQIAKNVLGVKCVIAIDIRESALAIAKEAGADYVTWTENLAVLLEEKDLIVDTACDFVGVPETFTAGLQAVRPRGVIVAVGLSRLEVPLNLLLAATKEVTVKGCMWGTTEELKEVLGFVKDGKVNPVVETRPSSQCTEAFEDLRTGNAKGRIVLVPK